MLPRLLLIALKAGGWPTLFRMVAQRFLSGFARFLFKISGAWLVQHSVEGAVACHSLLAVSFRVFANSKIQRSS
jgi:hypothetical protein